MILYFTKQMDRIRPLGRWHSQTIPQQRQLKVILTLFFLLIDIKDVDTATNAIVRILWACFLWIECLTYFYFRFRHSSSTLWYGFVVPSFVSNFLLLQINICTLILFILSLINCNLQSVNYVHYFNALKFCEPINKFVYFFSLPSTFIKINKILVFLVFLFNINKICICKYMLRIDMYRFVCVVYDMFRSLWYVFLCSICSNYYIISVHLLVFVGILTLNILSVSVCIF